MTRLLYEFSGNESAKYKNIEAIPNLWLKDWFIEKNNLFGKD